MTEDRKRTMAEMVIIYWKSIGQKVRKGREMRDKTGGIEGQWALPEDKREEESCEKTRENER